MKQSRRISAYIPEISAALAAVLVVVGALVPPQATTKIEVMAAGIILLAFGWLWTMREQRSLKQAAEGRAAQLAEEKEELERLLDAAISTQMGQGLEPDLKRTLSELARTLGADAVACFVLESGIGMLRPQPGSFGVGPGALRDFHLSSRADEPVSQVLMSGKPFLKQKGSGTPVPKLLPKGYGAGAFLLAPMAADGEVVGLLAVAAPDKETFSAKDVELAVASAMGCGLALVNERQLTSSRQQLKYSTVIKEVALAVNSTLELSHILHLFLGKARGIVDYDRAAVVLFDHGRFRVEALVDTEGGLRRRPHGREGSLAGSVYEAVRNGSLSVRTGLNLADAYATEAPEEQRLGVQYSEALVPLRAKGEVVGCVAFRTQKAEGFPDAIHAALYELANLGGMAISNSIAHSGAASQARHLDLLLGSLSEVSRVLTATTEGPEALERRVVETVAKLFDSQVALLSRVGEEGHRLVATFDAGGVRSSGKDAPLVVSGAGLLGTVALQQGTVRLAKATQRELLPPLAEVAARIDCGLAAPMFVDGEFQGALAVFGPRPYDDSETAVLTTVANQVAVALRNAELYDRSQRSIWELGNLHEGLKAIASSLDMQQVLDAILTKAAAVSGAQIGSVMVLEDGKLQLRALYGTDAPTAQSMTFGVGEGIAGRVLETGQPILANDVSIHPDFQKPQLGTIMPKALLCVPMRLGDEVIGVINLSNYQRTGVFDNDAVRVVTSLASQTSIAVENARLYQHLRSERDRLISLEEVLRQDLARDLHDGPVQRLAGMAMNVEVIKTLLRKDPERAVGELDELDQLVRLTIKEARTMLFELRPLVLETQGLSAALESYAEQYEANTGLRVELDLEPRLERMAAALEQSMFSVIQEAMGNVRKHARASLVEVSLRTDREWLIGRVIDDGRGFDVEATQEGYAERPSQSLGLVNMVERAERVGGKLKLESSPGHGTSVTVTVPRRHLEVRASTA